MTKFQLYVSQASINLGVTKPFNSTETEVSNWMDNKNPPTDDALNAEIDRLEAEYNANQYQRDRAVAYDPIPEQLDQIYHDMDGWKAKIKAVKDKYPKPSE